MSGRLLAPVVAILLARHWRDENAATIDDPKVVLPGHVVPGNMTNTATDPVGRAASTARPV